MTTTQITGTDLEAGMTVTDPEGNEPARLIECNRTDGEGVAWWVVDDSRHGVIVQPFGPEAVVWVAA